MNVVIFGSAPLAAKILRYLLQHPNAKVVGVVCKRSHTRFLTHYYNEPAVYTLALQYELPIFDLKDMALREEELNLDLGISGHFHRIISSQVLNLFRKGVLNCHGGPLPQYRGVHANINALINDEKRFAGTLHYADEGIDTGPIIARRWFDIEPNDTGHDVFCKTEQALWKLFIDNIDTILNDEDEATPQDTFIANGEQAQIYYKRDLETLKEVDWNTPSEELWRYVRAFDFPGREPVHTQLDGHTVYLRSTKDL
jgi:methionyl-tRNA formyltransferase